MKNHTASANRLFVDRAAVSVQPAPLCPSSMLLFRQPPTDGLDAAMRGFLVLCLAASMAICGLRGATASREADAPVVRAAQPTAGFCTLPAPARVGAAVSALASKAF